MGSILAAMTFRTVQASLLRSVMLMCLLAVTVAALAQDARLSFDVVSLHENKAGFGPNGEEPDSNVPLGPGNVYSPTGGQLNLRNIDLMQMVHFAYRMAGSQLETFDRSAPGWAREVRYDLKARTERANVSKDELRLMMRSLLADRFGLRVHTEDRETSVFLLQLVKQGEPGPHSRAHAGGPCSTEFAGSTLSATGEGFPSVCGGLLNLPGSTDRHYRVGARDLPITVFATSLTSWGDLGRPVVNDTGISGAVDFYMDFVPSRVVNSGADFDGDNFREALQKQLGLKLVSEKRAVPVWLLDAIARPTEN